MILVSTGTNGKPFNRLLDAVAQLERTEEIVVQHGPSAFRLPEAKNVDYLPFDDYSALVATARVVVTHGGVGSVLVALMQGKRAVVMPRLARLGEAVDDHQLAFARRLSSLGLATLIGDASGLQAAVAAAETVDKPITQRQGLLATDLARYLDEARLTSRRRSRARAGAERGAADGPI